MSTRQNKPSFPPKITLCCVGLALVLFGARVPAAPAESGGTEKARNIVPISRLDGPRSEVPEGDASQLFSVPGTSLKELVGRLAEAATDPAVKAVVILPEGTGPGSAQIEELRAAMAVVRDHGK